MDTDSQMHPNIWDDSDLEVNEELSPTLKVNMPKDTKQFENRLLGRSSLNVHSTLSGYIMLPDLVYTLWDLDYSTDHWLFLFLSGLFEPIA